MKYLFLIAVFVFIQTTLTSAQIYSDFSADDINGNEVVLSSYLEKGPVMLGFWSSRCTACRELQRNMKILYEKYKSYGFTYIGVNVDDQKTVSKVKSYVYANGFTFPVILDTDEKIFESYSGSAIPYYLFINEDKEVTNSTLGYTNGDEKMIEEEITLLLELK
ncbi:MAG: TlpA family protein disulfide reductase [Ignavibacteria bacterium]|nr:TlpA family protein disulfide reductase [Ignavibacteria bacterium]